MNENKPIDYETEYHKTFDNLMILHDKYKDLEEDWRYYQNLAGKYFEESIKLKKQNKQLKEENQNHKAMIEFLDTENTQIMNELKTRTQIQHQLEEENEQLKNKVHSVIDKRINTLENDYNKAVKAGMPSNGVYGEIELLKELKKELGE